MSNARKLAANLPREGQLGNRNLIINGAMQVSQRGDSTGVSTQDYYGPDRYSLGINGRDQFVLSISRASDGPDGYSNSYKIQTTTAETSITDTEYLMVRQVIEAQNLQNLAYGTSDAKQLTASFWVKSSVAATYAVFLYQYDGNRNIGSTYTINSANTWEYKTVTFAGDTGGTINDDNGNGMYLAFMLAVGPDMSDTNNTSWGSYTGGRLGFGHSTAANAVVTTTNATWQVTGVQLEVGPQSTPFEHELTSVTRNKCERYYYRHSIPNNNGQLVMVQDRGTNYYYGNLIFRPEMRATPSMSELNVDIVHKPGVRYDTLSAGPTFYQINSKGCYFNVGTQNTDATSTMGLLGGTTAPASGFIIADAEL